MLAGKPSHLKALSVSSQGIVRTSHQSCMEDSKNPFAEFCQLNGCAPDIVAAL